MTKLMPCLVYLCALIVFLKFLCTPKIAPSCLEAISSPQRPVVAVTLCATSKKMTNINLANTALAVVLIPSLLATYEPTKFEYMLYIGVNEGDALYENPATQRQLQAMLHNIFVKISPQRVLQKHRIPFNEILREAVADGADFLVRVNDDTEFVTPGWTSMGVAALHELSPPNIGVVGPIVKGLKGGGPKINSEILTHDMVHKVHLEIFKNTYYPPVFINQFIDDWITLSYGDRTIFVEDWKVIHHTQFLGTRYNADAAMGKQVQPEVRRAKEQIKDYLNTCGWSSRSWLHMYPFSP